MFSTWRSMIHSTSSGELEILTSRLLRSACLRCLRQLEARFWRSCSHPRADPHGRAPSSLMTRPKAELGQHAVVLRAGGQRRRQEENATKMLAATSQSTINVSDDIVPRVGTQEEGPSVEPRRTAHARQRLVEQLTDRHGLTAALKDESSRPPTPRIRDDSSRPPTHRGLLGLTVSPGLNHVRVFDARRCRPPPCQPPKTSLTAPSAALSSGSGNRPTTSTPAAARLTATVTPSCDDAGSASTSAPSGASRKYMYQTTRR